MGRCRQTILAFVISGMAASVVHAADSKIFDDHTVWRDEVDHPVILASRLGHGMIVMTMAYTNCQRTCPMTFKLLHEIDTRFAAKHTAADFIILSLDPQHDAREHIKELLGSTTSRQSQWHYLRGSAHDTEKMATALEIDAFNLDDHIVHKFKVWVFDAKGTMLHKFDWNHRDVSVL